MLWPFFCSLTPRLLGQVLESVTKNKKKRNLLMFEIIGVNGKCENLYPLVSATWTMICQPYIRKRHRGSGPHVFVLRGTTQGNKE